MPNIAHVYRSVIGVSIALLELAVGIGRFQGEVLCWADDIRPEGVNVYQMVTGDDSEGDRKHWDKLFSTRSYVFGKEPAVFLKDHLWFLSSGRTLDSASRALDLAMGEGRNAVFLAKKGFVVDGVDISEVALRKAKRLAHDHGVSINTIIADLTKYKIKQDYYSVILNFDYLQRDLIPQIKRGLKKGGVVVYENYTIDQLNNNQGFNIRRDFLLNKGELRDLFKDFQILVYHEVNNGKEAKASLIARKPL